IFFVDTGCICLGRIIFLLVLIKHIPSHVADHADHYGQENDFYSANAALSEFFHCVASPLSVASVSSASAADFMALIRSTKALRYAFANCLVSWPPARMASSGAPMSGFEQSTSTLKPSSASTLAAAAVWALSPAFLSWS